MKQKNVKPDKLFDAADSARMLLDVVDSLDETDNGSFFDYHIRIATVETPSERESARERESER